MFLGETDFVKNVFENIDWFQKSGSNSWVFDYSDQYLLRKAYHVNESIGLDYLCRVFQIVPSFYEKNSHIYLRSVYKLLI